MSSLQLSHFRVTLLEINIVIMTAQRANSSHFTVLCSPATRRQKGMYLLLAQTIHSRHLLETQKQGQIQPIWKERQVRGRLICV